MKKLKSLITNIGLLTPFALTPIVISSSCQKRTKPSKEQLIDLKKIEIFNEDSKQYINNRHSQDIKSINLYISSINNQVFNKYKLNYIDASNVSKMYDWELIRNVLSRIDYSLSYWKQINKAAKDKVWINYSQIVFPILKNLKFVFYKGFVSGDINDWTKQEAQEHWLNINLTNNYFLLLKNFLDQLILPKEFIPPEPHDPRLPVPNSFIYISDYDDRLLKQKYRDLNVQELNKKFLDDYKIYYDFFDFYSPINSSNLSKNSSDLKIKNTIKNKKRNNSQNDFYQKVIDKYLKNIRIYWPILIDYFNFTDRNNNVFNNRRNDLFYYRFDSINSDNQDSKFDIQEIKVNQINPAYLTDLYQKFRNDISDETNIEKNYYEKFFTTLRNAIEFNLLDPTYLTFIFNKEQIEKQKVDYWKLLELNRELMDDSTKEKAANDYWNAFTKIKKNLITKNKKYPKVFELDILINNGSFLNYKDFNLDIDLSTKTIQVIVDNIQKTDFTYNTSFMQFQKVYYDFFKHFSEQVPQKLNKITSEEFNLAMIDNATKLIKPVEWKNPFNNKKWNKKFYIALVDFKDQIKDLSEFKIELITKEIKR
ncbi:hypothetical protein [Mycoplasma hafezii]|uniref:hypothetical protein n=1 Tax=Mycoplasma hafezii TaxID=525886 RepID=UPI003CEB6E46